MRLWLLCLLWTAPLILGERFVVKGSGNCRFDGAKICHGAVTKETRLGVKICQKGGLRFKPKKKVAPGYPVVGRDTGPGKDCVWYGQTYCSGDVVIDLYRWTFQQKCGEGGRMRPWGKSWNVVNSDPRYDFLKKF